MRFMSLPILLGLAFVLRLIWALIIPVDPQSDSAVYEIFARNIAFHGVYGFTPEEPGAYWAVGTAAIYAGTLLIFGQGDFGVVAINMISSLIVVCGLYDLGRRWFDPRVGAVAALFFAIWPMAIQFTTVLASEIHFMALTLLALMAWDRAQNVRTPQFWVLTVLGGLMLVGATYVRPIALLIPAALAIAAVLRMPRVSGPAIIKAGVMTVLIFACVAPWSARNERIFGEHVFISTNFWPNFWMGNHAGTNGEYTPLPEEARGIGEIERGEYLKEISIAELKDAPGAFVLRTVKKAFRLHQRETIGVAWNEPALQALVGKTGVTVLKLASTGWWYLMVAGALVGIVALIRHMNFWYALLAPPVWLWLYFTGVHAVIVVGDRYHMPAIPMIALLAASGFLWVGSQYRGKHPDTR